MLKYLCDDRLTYGLRDEQVLKKSTVRLPITMRGTAKVLRGRGMRQVSPEWTNTLGKRWGYCTSAAFRYSTNS